MTEFSWVGLLAILGPRLLPALGATALLGLVALARGSVSGSGALGGLLVGVIFWLCGDWPVWTLLAVFFISSSLLGIPAKRLRPKVEGKHQRGGRRSWQQVAANTAPMLAAALFLPLTEMTENTAILTALAVSIVAGFAAAASDTWAGEIGVLSRRAPTLLWGLRPAEAGQSGAVTLLGSFGALAGALALAGVGLLAGIGGMGFVVAATWGFASSMVDSFLGATAQALYRDSTGQWTERPFDNKGQPHTLVRGWRWLNNDWVNFLSVTIAVVGGFCTFNLLNG